MHKRNALFVLLSTVIIAGAWLQCRSEESGLSRPAMQSQAAWSGPSADCAAPGIPKGASRVYIALRNGNDGSGRSASDARDGSTATAFDTILRCYSEGCPAGKGRPVAKTENLIVCI